VRTLELHPLDHGGPEDLAGQAAVDRVQTEDQVGAADLAVAVEVLLAELEQRAVAGGAGQTEVVGDHGLALDAAVVLLEAP